MRRFAAVMLAVALALVAFGATGCSLFSHAAEDANVLITSANASLAKYQASDAKVRELAPQLDALGITPADATKALGITAQIEAELTTQATELQAASDKIAKIKTLEVDDAFKKYADLEVAALASQQAVVAEGVKVYGEMDKLYIALRDGKADTQTTSKLSENIATYSANIKSLSADASKAIKTANDYFTKIGK